MATRALDEPIAVIGMALRFPQDAVDVSSYWTMLCEARHGCTEIPKSRFDINGFYDPNVQRSNTINTRSAHFVEGDLSRFDAQFFGISSAEANALDPKQRMLLEVSYQALENAGLSVDSVAGSDTAVYMANLSTQDYDHVQAFDTETLSMHQTTGLGHAMLANRVSHFFDFRGPSVLLDTACSGSLYALHLACQSIRMGESQLALVGGASIILSPEPMIGLSNAGFLSPDGRCWSFDAGANGYARGEGCGVVVLKRLSQALQDGDSIRSVIRATGVGNDGHTPSLTSPSGLAQEQLIRKTYESAKLDPSLTGYVEAHATGTPVGDPIETMAISKALASGRTRETNPLIIGSVKSNIGHLESASGVAALIKTTLMLENGLIPPQAGFKTLNPTIEEAKLPIHIPTKLMPWPTEGKRRASINNFGYGGANAHVVIDDAKSTIAELHGSLSRPSSNLRHNKVDSTRLVVLSAADELGVKRQADSLSTWLDKKLQKQPATGVFDSLCYTLNQKRTHLPWKAFVVAQDGQTLSRALKATGSKPVRYSMKPRIALVFTGQGANWIKMGMELMRYPIFAQSLVESSQCLLALDPTWSLLAEFTQSDTTKLSDPVSSQTLCTALQIALVDLLDAFGVKPASVIGHSSGEIAAAYAAGAIDRTRALHNAYYRGVSVKEAFKGQPRIHGMLAVGLSSEACLSIVTDLGCQDSVSVACLNSRELTTLSGPLQMLTLVHDEIVKTNAFARFINVPCAYHSQYMKRVASIYEEHLASLECPSEPCSEPSKPAIYSTLLGRVVDPKLMSENEYWISNLTSPVDFLGGLRTLVHDHSKLMNHTVFLEIGPHSALQKPVESIFSESGRAARFLYASLLRRDSNSMHSVLNAMGSLHTWGASVNLQSMNGLESIQSGPMLTDLPAYAFNYEKSYWHEGRLSREFRLRKSSPNILLGQRERNWNPLLPKWVNMVRVSDSPWLLDHCVKGACIFPATGYLAMAIEAMRQVLSPGKEEVVYHFRNVTFLEALHLAPNDDAEDVPETELVLQPDESIKFGNRVRFRIFGRRQKEWKELCRGQITLTRIRDREVPSLTELLEAHMSKDIKAVENISALQFYDNMEEKGLCFGPTFRQIDSLRYNDESIAWASVSPRTPSFRFGSDALELAFHPSTLDSILQTIAAGLSSAGERATPIPIPHSLEDLWISSTMSAYTRNKIPIEVTASSTMESSESCLSKATAIDATSGLILLAARNYRLKFIPAIPKEISSFEENPFEIGWQPAVSLASNAELQKYALAHSRQTGVDEATIKASENIARDYIHDALHSGEINERSTRKKHLHHHLQWMKGVEASNSSKATKKAGAKRAGQVLQDSNPLLDYMHKLGAQLPQVVNGTVDPFEAFFNDDTAADVYDFVWAEACQKIAQFVALMAHENPKLDILEIGAGTGSGTRHVLSALGWANSADDTLLRFNQYTFTDISSFFFSNARSNFSAYSQRMQFQTLDIGGDMAAQGFGEAQYDIVVAVSVLHAVPDIRAALKNSKRLLKPGGKLMLIEPVDLLYNHFTSGILPGWWNPRRADHRSVSPVLKVSEWEPLLREAGFELPLLDLSKKTPDGEHMEVTLVASASSLGGARSSMQSQPALSAYDQLPLIVLHGDTEAQASLGHQLQELIKKDLGLDAVARSMRVPFRPTRPVRIISLLEIDEPFVSRMDSEDLAMLKDWMQHCQDGIWVVREFPPEVQNPQVALFEGLARTVVNEYENRPFSFLTLDGTNGTSRPSCDSILRLLRKGLDEGFSSLEPQYKEQHGYLQIPRIRPLGSFGSKPSARQSSPRFDASATYVIVGGFGGVGRTVIRTMLDYGARHFLVVSRSAASANSRSRHFLQEVEQRGGRVKALSCDISQREDLERGLQAEALDMPPIRGCIHAGMILQSRLFKDVTLEDLHETLSSKVQGTMNLEAALPKDMQFFLLLSSIAGVVGTAGVGAYAAANTFQDAFARGKTEQGQRCISLNLGNVAGPGWISDNYEHGGGRKSRQSGFPSVTREQLAELIPWLCLGRGPHFPQVIVGLGAPNFVRRRARAAPARLEQPLFRNLHMLGVATETAAPASASIDPRLYFDEQHPPQERVSGVTAWLVEKLARDQNLSAASIDVNRPLYAAGVDSLMAMRVRSWLDKELGIKLATGDILREQSIHEFSAGLLDLGRRA